MRNSIVDHDFSVFEQSLIERFSCNAQRQPGRAAELTVIIPVLNEAKTIEEILDHVAKEPTPKNIVVVNDGSTDATAQLLQNWIVTRETRRAHDSVGEIVTLSHVSNRGKGTAIRTGLEYVQSEFVIVQDADLEVSPDEYPKLLKPIASGTADFVIGFRTQPGFSVSSSRIAHNLGVWLLNCLVRIIYGVSVKDEACCFKMLRTRDLKRMNLDCKGFEFCPEVVAKAARLGLRFSEVPISYAPRKCGDGKKLRLSDGLKAILTLWKYRNWREKSR